MLEWNPQQETERENDTMTLFSYHPNILCNFPTILCGFYHMVG